MSGATGRRHALTMCGVAMVAVFVANIIGGTVAQIAGASARRFDLVYRPFTMLLLLAGFSLLLRFGDDYGGRLSDGLKLPLRKPWLRDSLTGCLIGGLMVGLAVAGIAIGGGLNVNVRITRHTLVAGAGVIVILMMGAMLEELMFRGYPFQRLVEGIGAPGAIVCFSVFFGAVHLSNPGSSTWGFVNTIAVGVLFSLFYLRRKTLWMVWGVHFGWNAALGLLFGLPVSGLKEFSVIVKTRTTGPDWLTGGAYGIEGSALGTAVIGVGFVILLVFVKPVLTAPDVPPEPAAETPVSEAGAAPMS